MSPVEVSNQSLTTRSRLSILIALLSIVGLIAGFLVWRTWSKPALDRYNPVIEMLKIHQQKPDSGGGVNLGKAFPGLVPHDQVFVEYRDDGTFAVVVPVYFGEGNEMAGLLYTSRPLTEDDTRARTGNAIHFDQRMISVGTYRYLLLDERINQNWYHVSYKLH